MSKNSTPGERLRECIEQTYGSQAKLAEEIGVSQQHISAIVTGRVTSSTARYAVARALDTHPEEFWPEEDGSPEPVST